MSDKTQVRVIDGHEYTVTKLPARRSEKLFVRLTKILGPSVMGIFVGALAPAKDSVSAPGSSEVQLDHLPAAVAAFCDRLTEGEWEHLRDTLFELVLVDSRPILTGYDDVYQGRFREVMQVVWFALEVNYGFSFGSLVSAVRGLRPAAAPASPPSVSPGA